MAGRYASFKVDPSICFDNYYAQPSSEMDLPLRANFSRPIFIQTSYSHSTLSLPLSPPPLSRSDSSESLRGPASPATPITPAQDTITIPFRVAPVSSECEGESHHKEDLYAASSLSPDFQDSSKCDLRFSFEARVSKEYEAPKRPQSPVQTASQSHNQTSPQSPVQTILQSPSQMSPRSPPQLLTRFSERDRHARPPTICTPLLDTSVPTCTNTPEAQSASPTVTSFAEFRQALAERQEARRQEAAKKCMPALSFLSQDPFQCPLTKRRPKSIGRDEVSEDESSRPVSRKSTAPSVTSTRSTKSIRRGFSKVKQLLTLSRRDGEKDASFSAWKNMLRSYEFLCCDIKRWDDFFAAFTFFFPPCASEWYPWYLDYAMKVHILQYIYSYLTPESFSSNPFLISSWLSNF